MLITTWKKTMKLRTKIALAISASILASAASAASLDYRHEWKVESKAQAARIKLGTGWKLNKTLKANASIEMKMASDTDAYSFTELKTAGTELDIGLTYQLTKTLQLKPGMPIYMDADETRLKPQIRIQHNSTFGLKSALRYRHEFYNYTESSGKDQHQQKQKITYTGAYKIKPLKALKVSWEANYTHSLEEGAILSNGDRNWEWDAGLIVGYKVGNWLPFGELWTTDGTSSSSSQRQAKYRLGLKYYF